MASYYNELDTSAAAWLIELIAAKQIPDGYVDTRSIWDVAPEDLRDFTQHHFFAGIGGWAYALQLAGWPEDRPVWTGSCPCQPFSSAGKGAGFADERHLWPAWFHLISVCRPDTVFGEQVEAAVNHGWLDLVQDDLEAQDYAFAAVGLPAASVGAAHIRHRLWFVADTGHRTGARGLTGTYRTANGTRKEDADSSRCSSEVGKLANTQCRTPERHGLSLAGTACGAQGAAQERQWLRDDAGDGRDSCQLGDSNHQGPQGRQLSAERPRELAAGPSSVASGFWRNADWLPCSDGKARPVEPGTFPLAHGLPARVGRLRGYGNAIVPQVAAEVIKAFMEI